jgi:hypothetical protein
VSYTISKSRTFHSQQLSKLPNQDKERLLSNAHGTNILNPPSTICITEVSNHQHG